MSAGNIAGDRENVAPGLIFAAIDPETGGGLLRADGTVLLRNNVTNPALSGADPLAADASDQLGGARPSPPPAWPTSAPSSATRPSRPPPRPTMTCSPARQRQHPLGPCRQRH